MTTKPTEEESIIKAEEILNFHANLLADLDTTFRKYSLNDRLSPLQFSKAAEVLDLQIKNTGPYLNVLKTLEKLKDSEGNFILYDLLILSVILSRDTPNTKAQILYDLIDKELKGFVDRSAVIDLVNNIFRHSIDTIGGLICDGQSPYTSELRNSIYLFNLNSVKKCVMDKLVDFLMIGLESIKEHEFIERITFYYEGRFLSSIGLREILLKIYLSSIPKKKQFVGYTPDRILRKYITK